MHCSLNIHVCLHESSVYTIYIVMVYYNYYMRRHKKQDLIKANLTNSFKIINVISVVVVFLAFDFCRFCVVISFFHPRHNRMFGAKQGHYWYHFYNVFGMTRSLTGDWTRDLPHSKPSLYHEAIDEAVLSVIDGSNIVERNCNICVVY